RELFIVCIFLFFIPCIGFAGWQIDNMGSTGSGLLFGCAIGDGDNDNNIELYAASTDKYLYQYKWNGTLWDITAINGAGAHWMMDVTVGDGNADSENEVYGSNLAFHTYQYKWNGSSWDTTDIGAGGRLQAAIGDGDDDNSLEVYGVSGDSLVHRYEWSGSIWIESDLGATQTGTVMNCVVIGDGDNDGEDEVYSGSDSGLYKFKWNGSSWVSTFVDSLVNIGMKGMAIGDGNNDGEMEIYAISKDDTTLYQYKWNSVMWVKTPLISSQEIGSVIIGDGNADGEYEVYAGSSSGNVNLMGRIYQLKWNSVSWVMSDMGQACTGSVTEVCVGDGDNNGTVEVYASYANGCLYQYIFRSVPILTWTGDPGFELDGVDPDSGQSGAIFEFRVSYADSNNFPPLIQELQVDLNDNGTYEAWEKFSMVEMDTIDTTFTDGKAYTDTLIVEYAGDGVLNYKFVFRNLYDWAIGDPTEEHSFVVFPSAIGEDEVCLNSFSEFKLLKISPNPFHNSVDIRWQIENIEMQDVRSKMQDFTLKIYDATGILVKDFNLQSAICNMQSSVIWCGNDNLGRAVPDGVYFFRLTTSGQTFTRKAILLR
ncbi:T9SS type A sorting domain-containing protein, partial [candidate division WOR-3 bacterium]|nr:T9SS type A sorting domain-containing protein [candidate division WOR-3 bacterium]